MRFFGFLDRKKKIAPSSSSSVHPASNGQDLYSVKSAKIKERLGPVTPKECREVDELLNKTSWQANPSSLRDGDAYDNDDDEDEDEGSVDDDLIQKVEEKRDRSITVVQQSISDVQVIEKVVEKRDCSIAVVPQKVRSISDLQVSSAKVELAIKLAQSPLRSPHTLLKSPRNKPIEECATRKPCSMVMTMKSSAFQVLPRNPGSADISVRANALHASAKIIPLHQSSEDVSPRKPCGAMDTSAKMSLAQRSATKYRQVRPPKLTCFNDKAVALSSRNGLGSTSERTTAHLPDRSRGRQNARSHGSFPLPPPFACEKHYLPTPQTGTSEEVLCVAHPLPQPQPPTPMRTPNGCVVEQFDDKGQIQIARAITCDPLGKVHTSVKEYGSIPNALSLDPPKQLMPKQKAPQSIAGGGFPVPIQGLKSPPLTTPCLQSLQSPQCAFLATTGTELHPTPQGTSPTTPCKQHQTLQGLQSMPPTTPRPQTHQPLRPTLSTTIGTELHQTPQSTPPTTPRRHNYSTLHVLQSTPPTSPPPQYRQPPRNSLPTTMGTELHQTPPITPLMTPRQQNHSTVQVLQSTPPTSPLRLFHQTPRNNLSTATGAKLHQTPESTPPTTPHKQHHQTLQNIPPTSRPGLQLNPQVFANVTHNLQSPPPSNRKPPKLTSSYRQTPPHFPSPHAQLAQSPPCSPLSRSLCPRKWTLGERLGQGTFGTVHAGLNLEDGSFFAVKVCSREDTLPEIKQEVDVLSTLEHPNIVRYLGSSIMDNRLCIFLELVRMGSLELLLRRYKRFEEDTIRSYTRQILLGLEYLHRKKTIHRDIKCGNILVDVNGQVKLSDFGIAKQVGESPASSLKGTPLYMAPEVLMPCKDSKSSYSFPADIWSLGCTVLELADGKPPWSNLPGFGFFFKVKRRELPPMPENLSPDGRDFIRSCLQFNPKDRPTASELLQHPFVLNAPTPEPLPLSPLSPSSPLSPKLWPAVSPLNSSTWAYGHCCPSSPIQETCFDRVLGGSQRVQTLIQGR